MQLLGLESVIEAILFASGEAVELKELAEAIEQDIETTRKLVNNLSDRYIVEKRGMRIINIENGYQMCTNPDYFTYIKNLYGVEKKKSLSPALLETLAIIAYKQPITRAEIEAIRGVSAEHAVNTLIKYKLVCEKGRKDAPGKPILFGTTDDFLRFFGFDSISNLPKPEEPSKEAIMEIEEQLKLNI